MSVQIVAESFGLGAVMIGGMRNQHPSAWSGPIANRFNNPSCPHLRQTLEEMGLHLD